MSGRGGLIRCWARVYFVSFQSPPWTVHLWRGQPILLQLLCPGFALGPLQKQSLSGPMPFPGCPLGQDFKCLQFGLIPRVSHSKYPCIFQSDTLWPCSPPQCGNNSFCFTNGTAGWLICASQAFPADATYRYPSLTKVLHKHSETWRPSLIEGERQALLSVEKDS